MTKIFLDKERELRLTLGAMKRFHSLTGVNLMKETFKEITPEIIEAFIWSCLVGEDSSLTLEQVGEMIDFKKLNTMTEAIISLTSGKDDENPLSDIGHSADSIPVSVNTNSGD